MLRRRRSLRAPGFAFLGFAMLSCYAILVVSSVASAVAYYKWTDITTSSLKFQVVVSTATSWTDPALLVAFLFGPLLLVWWQIGDVNRDRPSTAVVRPVDEAAGRAIVLLHGAVIWSAVVTIIGGIVRVLPWIKEPSAHARWLDTYAYLGQGLVACALGVLAIIAAGRIADGAGY